MKKVLTTLMIAGMFAFYACGPSAEDKAKADQAQKDSIAKAEEAAKPAQTMAADTAMKADTTTKK